MTIAAAQQPLPAWASELSLQYTANAANQFILHGNTDDRFLIPGAPMAKAAPSQGGGGGGRELGNLTDFLLRSLLCNFDVVLSYDLGNSIRIEKGQALFADWPALKEVPGGALPKTPRAAIETLTHYFRYVANLARLNRSSLQVACIIKAAHLLAPNVGGGANFDLSAIALMIRDWSTDTALVQHTLATILLTENLNDLSPLLVNNHRACRIPVPLPTAADLGDALAQLAPQFPRALSAFTAPESPTLDKLAAQLVGASLVSIESLLRTREHAAQSIAPADVLALKKTLVENDANGLIEFIESRKTLDDLYGQEKIKEHIRQDIALWKNDDTAALPMGYLLAGPVGTGKTFMVNCIAGEAGVPVVKLKNFRDKWVGSTEGNLEKIFRLLHALGRCFVFIDEADQALGKRDADSGDSGVGGRVYGMMAQEMSNPANRGKIIWVLASSRPDLIEVDLKRPGRIDVKIPLFPTTTPEESYQLLRALLKRMSVMAPEKCPEKLRPHLPDLLTPGAAEALAVKAYRQLRTTKPAPSVEAVLVDILDDYQLPVPPEVMSFQIALAVKESSDLDFVPQRFRSSAAGGR